MGAYAKSGASPISGLIKPGDVPPHGGLYLLDVVPDGEVRFGFPNINDNAEIAVVHDDRRARQAFGPQAKLEGPPRAPPPDRAADDEEETAQPRDADHPFAIVSREQMVVEVEDPELGPLPLARPARDSRAGRLNGTVALDASKNQRLLSRSTAACTAL